MLGNFLVITLTLVFFFFFALRTLYVKVWMAFTIKHEEIYMYLQVFAKINAISFK